MYIEKPISKTVTACNLCVSVPASGLNSGTPCLIAQVTSSVFVTFQQKNEARS